MKLIHTGSQLLKSQNPIILGQVRKDHTQSSNLMNFMIHIASINVAVEGGHEIKGLPNRVVHSALPGSNCHYFGYHRIFQWDFLWV